MIGAAVGSQRRAALLAVALLAVFGLTLGSVVAAPAPSASAAVSMLRAPGT